MHTHVADKEELLTGELMVLFGREMTRNIRL